MIFPPSKTFSHLMATPTHIRNATFYFQGCKDFSEHEGIVKSRKSCFLVIKTPNEFKNKPVYQIFTRCCIPHRQKGGFRSDTLYGWFHAKQRGINQIHPASYGLSD